MSIEIHGQKDEITDQIFDALKPYNEAHPRAKIELRRQNSVSVRVRIIDPDFSGMDKQSRHQTAWQYLDTLSEDAQGDISLLLLLTPDEIAKSFANFEFENPTPSHL